MTDPRSRSVDAVFFDLFGTLVSLEPLGDECERLAAGRGAEIAARWRSRQLELSWLRTVMGRWVDFDAVTTDALAATLAELEVVADPSAIRRTCEAFAELPARDEARPAIDVLRGTGIATGVLTNASARTLARVLARGGIPVDHALSADAVERFKPHPSVYRLAVDAAGVPLARIGFVTGNGWDAAGASAFGFRVAWLRAESAAVMPPVGAPDPLVAAWRDLPSLFGEATREGR